MEAPAAQQWLERKMSRRDDVVSALVLVSSPEGLRTAAVWPRGSSEQRTLADAARATFTTGLIVDRDDQDLLIPVRASPGASPASEAALAPDTAPADTDVALRAQRVLAKPIFSRGRRVGALAFALRDSDDDTSAQPLAGSPAAPPRPRTGRRRTPSAHLPSRPGTPEDLLEATVRAHRRAALRSHRRAALRRRGRRAAQRGGRTHQAPAMTRKALRTRAHRSAPGTVPARGRPAQPACSTWWPSPCRTKDSSVRPPPSPTNWRSPATAIAWRSA